MAPLDLLEDCPVEDSKSGLEGASPRGTTGSNARVGGGAASRRKKSSKDVEFCAGSAYYARRWFAAHGQETAATWCGRGQAIEGRASEVYRRPGGLLGFRHSP